MPRHMKFQIKNIAENPASLMRRAGYVFQRSENNEMSFVRVMAQSGFPRFHCYTHVEGKDLVGTLHLDQKKETYGREARHHGEYGDEGALHDEIERLKSIVPELTLLA